MKPCLSSVVNRPERIWCKRADANRIWSETSESPPPFPCFNFLTSSCITADETYTCSMSVEVRTDSRLSNSSAEAELSVDFNNCYT